MTLFLFLAWLTLAWQLHGIQKSLAHLIALKEGEIEPLR